MIEVLSLSINLTSMAFHCDSLSLLQSVYGIFKY